MSLHLVLSTEMSGANFFWWNSTNSQIVRNKSTCGQYKKKILVWIASLGLKWHCPLLVSTHMVCERLPAMQEQTRLVKFLVQNSLSAPTQVFEECGATYPPPPPPLPKFGQDLGLQVWICPPTLPPQTNSKIWPDWGTLDFSWSRVHSPPPNENLARLRDFGCELGQSNNPPPPTPMTCPHENQLFPLISIS